MHQRLLWLLVGVLLLLAPRHAHAQTPPTDVADALDRIAAQIEAGDSAGAADALRALERESQIEAQPWLSQIETDPALVAQQLRTTAAWLRQPITELPDDAADRLEQVVATINDPGQLSIWERLQRWLLRLLERLLEPLVRAAMPSADLLRALVVCIVVPVVLVVLWWLVRRLLRLRSRQRALTPLIEGEIPVHATAAQEQAGIAAQAGDYREAIRLLYIAALLHLDEVGRLRFDRALTNLEVLASVRDDVALRTLLAPVVTQFDRVWYGHAPFGADEFGVMESQLTQLRQMGGVR